MRLAELRRSAPIAERIVDAAVPELAGGLERRSLTTFSRTGRTAPDSGANLGHPMDNDLGTRILAHGPDLIH